MRRAYIVLPIVLSLLAAFWSSCEKDDLMTITNTCDTCQTTCDTSFKVSYTNDIVPILAADCYSCHNHISATPQGGSNVLDDYNSLVVYVQNGKLMASITWAEGAKNMPEDDPKISDCKIARIDRWIKQGAPNN